MAKGSYKFFKLLELACITALHQEHYDIVYYYHKPSVRLHGDHCQTNVLKVAS